MKKSLTGKAAGIAVLVAIIAISLIEQILRATVFTELSFSTSSYARMVIPAVLAAALLFFALAGKTCLFRMLCGGWIAYFVLNQLYELPATVGIFIEARQFFGTSIPAMTIVENLLNLLFMGSVVVLGVGLMGFLSGRTAWRKGLYSLCLVALLLAACGGLCIVYHLMNGVPTYYVLSLFYSLSQAATVGLIACFVRQSAEKAPEEADL